MSDLAGQQRTGRSGQILLARFRGDIDVAGRSYRGLLRLRTDAVPEGLPFGHDAASLAAAEVWNLVCADGEFDISFHPSGFTGGYAQLAVNAHRVRVGAVEVVVADLAEREAEPG